MVLPAVPARPNPLHLVLHCPTYTCSLLVPIKYTALFQLPTCKIFCVGWSLYVYTYHNNMQYLFHDVVMSVCCTAELSTQTTATQANRPEDCIYLHVWGGGLGLGSHLNSIVLPLLLYASNKYVLVFTTLYSLYSVLVVKVKYNSGDPNREHQPCHQGEPPPPPNPW